MLDDKNVYKFLYIFLFLFLIPIVLHAYAGTFSRMRSDDYCSAYIARDLGFIQSQRYWYINWSGRYSANILDALVGLAGPLATSYTVALGLLLWLIPLYLSIKRMNLKPILALSAAALILSTILASNPSIHSVLYWGQGMRSIIPWFILLSTLLVIESPVTALFICFVAGGFSETFAAFQVILCLVLFLIIKERRRFYLSALIGATLSIILVALAPGNAIRMARYPYPPGLYELTLIILRSFSEFSIYNIRHNSYQLATIFAFALLYIRPIVRHSYNLLLLPIITILTLTCFAPAAWALSENLPLRTFIIPQSAIMIGIMVWGSMMEKPRYKITIFLIVFLLIGISLLNITSAFEGLNYMRSYAEA